MSKPNVSATSISDTGAASESPITGSAKGLVKGLSLVDIVEASIVPLRQVDLAEASGLPRPTVARLLDVLCGLNVLTVSDDGFYGLGPRLAGWGQSFVDRLDLGRLGSSIVNRLVDLTQETVFMGVQNGNSLLYVYAGLSPHAVRPAAHVGARNPLHSTGIGKAILAGLTDAERDPLLNFPLERRTANTLVDRESLFANLDLIRERGYSIDDVENEEGVRCVAAPIWDHRGKTVAAMSISAPAYRFSLNDVAGYAADVVGAAAELSARLGYRESSTPMHPELNTHIETEHLSG